MKKIISVTTFLILINVPFSNENNLSPAANFDGYHNCIREWWNLDAFIHADKNYSITASFEYEKETPAANLFFTIFDWDENKVYNGSSYGDNISVMKCQGKSDIEITYKNSWMRGSYPHYIFHFENSDMIAEINLLALSPPQFVAGSQGGILPMGLGYYKYLFVPKCKVDGWILIEGERKNITGVGYYEHVWGNWSYHHPLKGATIKPYINLTKWWWKNKNIFMDELAISSDNPFGYDWAWISFDNGWTLFYGTIPFWVEGIPLSIFYLYDGAKVIEFGNIWYKYVDGVFYDGTYIPTKIKVVGKGEYKLYFTMEMDHSPHVYEDNIPSFLWKSLLLYECPGRVTGYYENESGERINLTGVCEMEIERQISIFQYFLFKISPLQNGFEFLFLSTLLNTIFTMSITLFPFSVNFSFSNIR